MTAEKPMIAGTGDASDAAAALRILALLQADDLDAAIEAGLPGFQRLAVLDDAANAALAAARDRLLAAWAARARYQARNARLERLAAERRRERAPRHPADAAARRPALPAAAAAALARARARVEPGRKP